MGDIQNTQTIDKFEYIAIADKDNNVITELDNKLTQYKNVANNFIKVHLKSLEEQDVTNKAIDTIIDKIKQIHDTYNKSDIYGAYTMMKKTVEDYYDFLSIYKLKYMQLKNIYKDKYHRLFRGRTGDYNSNFTRENIFHIPFNLREKVSTERFSIPGQPCLYLGQSIFTVWQELRRPRIEELYVSRFRADENLKILDMALTYNELCKVKLLSIPEIAKKYLITNLFRIACSVRVKNADNRSFKSEYIIPQLLLLVITNLENEKESGMLFNQCRHSV